ncbi:uncharacterized protein A1O9_08612 [Exophiala aquamarina CBS 119918]|uniref:Uncharacterized protein n=1 Tax=Exophiala aquamarina CBS 119918 TaxID=1182545 RepID=A0A072PHE8_9EURO|nr:uncharacterized protein A1O9_08612 [Exophiala aquamarina CBS 119918]KEF54960.1 hypothetical protein A1O9_08612 [Exophiala aquamarina CBS 119918]
MRPLRALSATLPLAFATLSLAFIITAFVSREWAKQDFFSPNLQITDWDPDNPLYTLYRSPFTVCTVEEIPGTSGDGLDSTFDVSCERYRAYGRGKTSCELPSDTGTTSGPTNGDARMCEQVHYAGNLIIAALAFSCLAFVLCVVLFLFSFITYGHRPAPVSGANGGATTTASETKGRRGRRAAYATLRSCFLCAAAVSAMATFLAQCFGILGLVQSQPDNGLYASFLNGNSVLDGDLSHAPWVQGWALSVYATLGWLCAALAAGTAAGWYRS